MFASAYDQLTATQRTFVDGVVAEFEREASRSCRPVAAMLQEPMPVALVAQSRGMLDMPLVRAAIVQRVNELSAATSISLNRVVRTLANIAFSNMKDYVSAGEDGVAEVDLSNLTDDQWEAVEVVDVEYDPRNSFTPKRRKIKLHSKMDALKMLLTLYDPSQVALREAANSARTRAPSLPAGVSVEGAADAYSALING